MVLVVRAVVRPWAAQPRRGGGAWTGGSETSHRTGTAGTQIDPEHPRRLSSRLNSVLGGPAWLPDGSHVIAYEVPAERGEEPPAPTVPRGPNVRATSGTSSPLRTYQDLLSNAYDEALFEHYATSSASEQRSFLMPPDYRAVHAYSGREQDSVHGLPRSL